MLHGEIKVNHNEIAKWSAVNKGPVPGNEEHTLYECNLTYINGAGYPMEAIGYEIIHRRQAGALILAGNVIQGGKSHLKPKRMDTDEEAVFLVSKKLN